MFPLRILITEDDHVSASYAVANPAKNKGADGVCPKECGISHAKLNIRDVKSITQKRLDRV